MTDIAEIGFRVDTSELKRARQELTQVGEAGAKAGQTAQRGLERYEQGARDAGQATRTLSETSRSYSQRLEGLQRGLSSLQQAQRVAAQQARANSTAQSEAAAGSERSRRQADQQSESLARLQRNIQQTAAEARRLNGTYDSNITQLGQLAQQQQRVSSAAVAQSRAFKGASQSTREFRSNAQNVAFQIQDIAVQLQAGTSASLAFGQQLPQLLGGFGALGAAIGAAVAVAGPFIGDLIGLGDAAEDAADKLSDLSESQKNYNELIKLSNALTGEAADKARELAVARRAEEVQTTESSLSEARKRLQSLGAEIEAQEKLTQRLEEFQQSQQGKQFESGVGPSASELQEQASGISALRENYAQAQETVTSLEVELARLRQGVDDVGASGETAAERTANLRSEFSSLQAELQPLVGLQEEYDKKQRLINNALDDGIIKSEQAARLNKLLAESYRDQFNPVQAIKEELDQEQRLLRMASDEREIHSRLIQIENRLRSDQIDLTEGQREALERELQEIQRLEEANANASKSTRDLGDSTKDATEELSRMEEALQSAGDEAVRSIQGQMADAFDSLFRGSLQGARDFLSSLDDIFRRSLAELAATVATQKIIIPIGAQVVGGALAGLGGGAGGGASGLGNLGQLASLGGGSGITSSINSAGAALGFAPGAGATGAIEAGTGAVAQGGVFGGTTLTGFAGGAGLGFGAGTLANSILGGNSTGGTIGAGGGALAGAALGSAFPVVGTIAGGLAGGLLGGIGGGLFGNDTTPRGISAVNLRTREGQISEVIANEQLRKDTSREAQQQTARAVTSAISAITQAGGGRFLRPEFGITSNVERNRGTFIDPDVTRTGDRIRVSQQAGDIEAFIREVFTNPSLTEGVSREVSTALVNSTAEDIDQLVSDVQFAAGLEETFTRQKELGSAFLQQLDQLQGQFENTRERADELGLSTDDLSARYQQLVSELRGERELGLQLEAQGLSQFGGNIVQVAQGLQALRNEADELGVSSQTVAQIIDQRFNSALEGISQGGLQQLIATLQNLGGTIPGIDTVLAELNERLESVRDGGGGAADTARSIADAENAVISARENLITVLERERDEVRQTAETFRRAANELAGAQQDLRFGETSPLSPGQRFRELQQQFREVGQRARLGDQEALQRLPELARRFDEARAAFLGTSGERSVQVFENIQSTLELAEGTADRQTQLAEQQISRLNQQIQQNQQAIAAINGTTQAVTSVEEAVRQVNAAITNLRDISGDSGAGGTRPSAGRTAADVEQAFQTAFGRSPDQASIDYFVQNPSGSALQDVLSGARGEDIQRARERGLEEELARLNPDVEGFANGGSFTIGGRSGRDQNVLSINGQPTARVSSGESVNIDANGTSTSDVVAAIEGLGQRIDRLINVQVQRGEMDEEREGEAREERRQVTNALRKVANR